MVKIMCSFEVNEIACCDCNLKGDLTSVLGLQTAAMLLIIPIMELDAVPLKQK